jgi:ABC-type transport system involved in multi-copper enzyme maturation permease subunit
LCERNHRALSVAFALAIPLAAWSVASGTAKLWIEGFGLILLFARIDKWSERVRRPREEHLPPVEEGQTIQITVDTDSVMDRVFVPHREAKPFRDDRNPVYEREWIEESATEGRDWWHFLLRINIGLAVLVAIALICTRFWLGSVSALSGSGDLDSKLAYHTQLAQWLLFTYVIVVAVLIGPAQSANAISKERERQTGDLLLTTLLRPSEIVLGKWRLSVKSCFHLLVLLLVPLIPVGVLLCFGGGGGWLNLLVTAACGLAIVVATLVTLNTLGIFCSLVCETSAQALATAYTVAVGWFVGPVVLYYVLTRFSEIPAAAYAWATYATPFVGFFQLTGSDFFSQATAVESPFAVVGMFLALTAVVSVALITVAVLGFNRFWRRE